jgi:uncharacterized protein (DUF1015 family)
MTGSSARIQPFAALHFDADRVGPVDRVIAPPYDLIDRALQERLYERSPRNIVRLELSRAADPYADAAAILAQWRSDGTLIRWPTPVLYFYTQRFDHAGRRLTRSGLIARVQLEEFATGRILPHERTFPKAKEDRLRLLEATHTNISSIFGLYPSADAELARLIAKVAQREPVLEATDDLGIRNEISVIDRPDEIAIVQRTLEAPRILIADGHHRYETALEYRRRQRAIAETPSATQPFDYAMMTLVAFDDPGLVILPTHRLVRRISADALAAFPKRLAEEFAVDAFTDRASFLAALEARGRGAIGIALKSDHTLCIVTLKRPSALAAALPDAPIAVRELDVSILHALIFDRICGITAEEVRKGGNLEYTIDAPGALAEVVAGKADGAFLMNPPTVADIERVSSAGATMPEKSTYFFPKLITGLVMNPLED